MAAARIVVFLFVDGSVVKFGHSIRSISSFPLILLDYMYFDSKMFTNKFRNRLNYNAIPTIFSSLEGCSKDLPLDHTYCRPKLVNLEDEEVPPKKTRVLADILLNPGHESAVPTESKSENLIMHELEPLNLS
ncbi:hypothetical protein NQ317_002824, partial [Molorchus minor]